MAARPEAGLRRQRAMVAGGGTMKTGGRAGAPRINVPTTREVARSRGRIEIGKKLIGTSATLELG
jgi:hypothetical protein